MPSFIALVCLEVGEKFTVGGVVGGGGISTPTTESNQLKLGQVDVELGCDNMGNSKVSRFKSRWCGSHIHCSLGVTQGEYPQVRLGQVRADGFFAIGREAP